MVLILLVVGATIIVVLLVGSLFLQGYFYTEASEGLFWRAPAAGVIVTGFLFFWCWLNANDARSSPGYLPYNSIFLFSPEVKLMNEPVKRFWNIRKGVKQEYIAVKIPQGAGNVLTQYHLTGQAGQKGPIWHPSGVEKIILKHEDQEYEFLPNKAEDNDYPTFVSKEGWVMTQYDTGVTGLPRMFHTGLFLANLGLNVLHFGLWFACFWNLLRFQPSHAFGLAFAVWLVMTLFVVPQLLGLAVEVVRS